MTPEGFAAAAGVSRETLARLEAYAALLRRWQPRINLVANDSVADLWRRHMLDSAQLLPLVPPADPARAFAALDLGSGAGFPGLVLAILGVPGLRLVEADARKCAFLREAARAAGLALERDVSIVNRRLEQVPPFAADLVTARAVADLPELLEATERFRSAGTICLFHKGLRATEELTRAGKSWRMTVEQFPSRSDPTGTILRLTGVQRERSR
ncbi:MAG: 16S rRNA (guanine(527)-N(7))-methyltransferase RsmG [Dongiaceae bacterium]